LFLGICTLAGRRIERPVLIGRSLSMVVQPVSPKRVIFCVDQCVCDGSVQEVWLKCMVDWRQVAWWLVFDRRLGEFLLAERCCVGERALAEGGSQAGLCKELV
jgi:hypothetical protein